MSARSRAARVGVRPTDSPPSPPLPLLPPLPPMRASASCANRKSSTTATLLGIGQYRTPPPPLSPASRRRPPEGVRGTPPGVAGPLRPPPTACASSPAAPTPLSAPEWISSAGSVAVSDAFCTTKATYDAPLPGRTRNDVENPPSTAFFVANHTPPRPPHVESGALAPSSAPNPPRSPFASPDAVRCPFATTRWLPLGTMVADPTRLNGGIAPPPDWAACDD